MPSCRSGLALLSPSLFFAFIVGCQPAAKPVVAPPPPPASEEDVVSVQADFQQHDPNARAGSVTMVRPEEQLVAVTLSPSGDAKTSPAIAVGDTFTFIDSKQNPMANGKVISVDHDLLVLSYIPAAGGRPPKEGDIAIHLSTK